MMPIRHREGDRLIAYSCTCCINDRSRQLVAAPHLVSGGYRSQTKEIGLGTLHFDCAVNKIRNRYGTELTLQE